MKERLAVQSVRGQRAVDGAGVRLVRVLGSRNAREFDPFLMLDFFDSDDPADYLAGFPMHPHRGIETITYLISGRIEHEDSLGNQGVIRAGESQWMTAGSGILHQEMPKEEGRMLGFQLWLNLPAAEKMAKPEYLGIDRQMMPEVELKGARVRVVSGEFSGVSGVTPNHIPATIYDVSVSAGESIQIPTRREETAFAFLIEGEAVVGGAHIARHTALLFDQGEAVTLSAPPESGLRFAFFSAPALGEPIAWGGPIVMNTRGELEQAFSELREGTFIKHEGRVKT